MDTLLIPALGRCRPAGLEFKVILVTGEFEVRLSYRRPRLKIKQMDRQTDRLTKTTEEGRKNQCRI